MLYLRANISIFAEAPEVVVAAAFADDDVLEVIAFILDGAVCSIFLPLLLLLLLLLLIMLMLLFWMLLLLFFPLLFVLLFFSYLLLQLMLMLLLLLLLLALLRQLPAVFFPLVFVHLFFLTVIAVDVVVVVATAPTLFFLFLRHGEWSERDITGGRRYY